MHFERAGSHTGGDVMILPMRFEDDDDDDDEYDGYEDDNNIASRVCVLKCVNTDRYYRAYILYRILRCVRSFVR